NGTFTLTGTQLNGISEGSSYGDDVENSSNYPIVQLVNGSQVTYARTSNWSNTGVATGSTIETTLFTPPAGYTLSPSITVFAPANGFSSNAFVFGLTGPYFGVTSASTSTANTLLTVTVTAYDQNNSVLTGYAGTVHISSSDSQVILPANASLT